LGQGDLLAALVEPVVLRVGAGQLLKEIVDRTVFLDDHDDVRRQIRHAGLEPMSEGRQWNAGAGGHRVRGRRTSAQNGGRNAERTANQETAHV
jgi:hypothetical protein